MSESSIDVRKKVAKELLGKIDEIETQKEYMTVLSTILQFAMEAEIAGKANMEALAVASTMARCATEEGVSYKTIARKAADSIENMFKGMFALETRIASGEKVNIEDVFKQAEAAANGKV